MRSSDTERKKPRKKLIGTRTRNNWKKIIGDILETTKITFKDEEFHDIILGPCINNHKREFTVALKIKRLQMITGQIWQKIIGSVKYIDDLDTGHPTKLDILSHKRRFAMELKNRYNTTNSGSLKTVLDNLARYKRQHPKYEVIYAVINDRKPEVQDIYKTHDGIEYRYLSGTKLLKFIFGRGYKKIVNIYRKLFNAKYDLDSK